ncbi:MAG: LPS export ABC transporter periplasmic protein LptC [Treponema sp.]|nr:LPS export ABC transporter periplasmic protein LptC [Treponema sp.]
MEAFSAKAAFRLLLTLLLPPLASCSLNYAQNQAELSSSPEFTLRTASFFRYEDNAISFSLDSPRIEQYSSPSVTFVEDAVFSSYSKDGELETKGRCSLLGISQTNRQDESELTFYGEVFLEQLDDGLTLESDALKWNTGTGRVAAPSKGLVTLTKGGLTLEGEGFSAQEKGTAFSFAANVSGFIITDDDKEGGQQ